MAHYIDILEKLKDRHGQSLTVPFIGAPLSFHCRLIVAHCPCGFISPFPRASHISFSTKTLNSSRRILDSSAVEDSAMILRTGSVPEKRQMT